MQLLNLNEFARKKGSKNKLKRPLTTESNLTKTRKNMNEVRQTLSTARGLSKEIRAWVQ